jgi:hypothetical protein
VSNFQLLTLDGLVTACLPLDPRFAGSNPAEDYGFLTAIKVHSTASFGCEVKTSVPCRNIYGMFLNNPTSMKESYVRERDT